MAFKDVRELTEHLQQLDYPHRFTISTLAQPHGNAATFQHVATVLQWLAGRLEPGAQLAGSAASEAGRVALIRSAVEFFVTRAALRLNPRRLYASSSASAAELLKVTQLLVQTMAQQPEPKKVDSGGAASNRKKGDADANDNDDDDDEAAYADPELQSLGGNNFGTIDLGDRIEELRRARQLSGELTQGGAQLYDLLAKELLNRERRTMQATRPLELAAVERALKTAVGQLGQRVQTIRRQVETARTEKQALQAKVDRKAGELERLKQRLGALQKIRPAYLEDFERLEIELQSHFVQYALRVRCLDALRAQVTHRAARAATATRSADWPVAGAANKGDVTATGVSLASLLPADDDEGSWNGYRMGGGPDRAGGGDFGDDDDDDMRAVDELMARGRTRRRDAAAMAEAAGMIRDSKTAGRLRVRTAAKRASDGVVGGGGGGDGRFVGSMAGGGGDSDGEDDVDAGDSSLGSDDANGSYSDLDLAPGLHSDEDDEEDDEDGVDGGGGKAERAMRGAPERRMLRRTDALADGGDGKAAKAMMRAGMSDEEF